MKQDLDLSVRNKYSPAAAMSIFSSDHILPEETEHRKEKQHSTHGIVQCIICMHDQVNASK